MVKVLSGKDFSYSIWNKHPEWDENEAESYDYKTVVFFSYKKDSKRDDIEPEFLQDEGFEILAECLMSTDKSIEETEKFLEDLGFEYSSDCDFEF